MIIEHSPKKIFAFSIENKFRSDIELSQNKENFNWSFNQLGLGGSIDNNLITAGILRGFCVDKNLEDSEIFSFEDNYKWHDEFFKLVFMDYANHYKALRADYVSKGSLVKEPENMPEYYSGVKSPKNKTFKTFFNVDLDVFLNGREIDFGSFLIKK